jgi:hypothetical protein
MSHNSKVNITCRSQRVPHRAVDGCPLHRMTDARKFTATESGPRLPYSHRCWWARRSSATVAGAADSSAQDRRVLVRLMLKTRRFWWLCRRRECRLANWCLRFKVSRYKGSIACEKSTRGTTKSCRARVASSSLVSDLNRLSLWRGQCRLFRRDRACSSG